MCRNAACGPRYGVDTGGHPHLMQSPSRYTHQPSTQRSMWQTLHRSAAGPAWLGEKPGEDHDTGELQPERHGLPQVIEAPSFGALAIKVFKEKKGAHGDAPRLPLEEMNQEDHGNAEERPKADRIGE